jgi:hypothetical protein
MGPVGGAEGVVHIEFCARSLSQRLRKSRHVFGLPFVETHVFEQQDPSVAELCGGFGGFAPHHFVDILHVYVDELGKAEQKEEEEDWFGMVGGG